MSLVGKFVSELEINAPAEKYYEIFKDKVAHIPNISPTLFQNVEVHEGDWDTHGHGSIKVWNYTLGMYKRSSLLSPFLFLFILYISMMYMDSF